MSEPTLLQSIMDAANTIRKIAQHAKTNSIIDVAKYSRVEPLGVVSDDLIAIPWLGDVFGTELNIITAYYLLAAAGQAQINGVKIKRVMDSLNPNRDLGSVLSSFESHVSGKEYNEESFQYRLPNDLDNLHMEDYNRKINMEAINRYDTYNPKTGKSGTVQGSSSDLEQHKKDMEKIKNKPNTYLDFKTELNKMLQEQGNVAVGKMIEVDVQINEQKLKFPAIIRLNNSVVDRNSLIGMLAKDGQDLSFVERYHDVRSGKITFWKDFVLCQDLIDSHKKALMNDKTGIYSEIMTRARGNQLYGVISGTPSLNTAANILTVSKTVADEAARRQGGKLNSFRIREKMMDKTYAMLLVVVDQDYERITFYTRGIATETSVSYRELKGNSKEKGPDIAEILKSFTMGNTISL